MKIAHINYLPYDNVIGVEKKLSQQAKSARESNINMDFIVINSKVQKIEKNLQLLKMVVPSNFLLKTLYKKLFKFKVIENSVNLNNYDYIILRYPDMDFSSIYFMSKYVNKIVTEHHTNELGELETSKKNLTRILKIYIEKKFAPNFISKSKGIIGVTDEIRQVELTKTNDKIPSTVISNGINVNEINFTSFKFFDDKELTLIFVASSFAPWHGLDRLLEGLKHYDGQLPIRLNLIGSLPLIYHDQIKSISNKTVSIEILGKKYGEELDHYFRNSNIAISSLALHRNGMEEACVLKTREYIARGIPFIYAYCDSDLSGDESFALLFDSNDLHIDIKKLITFSKKVSSIKNISSQERSFAKKYLDWEIKIKQMNSFVKTLDV